MWVTGYRNRDYSKNGSKCPWRIWWEVQLWHGQHEGGRCLKVLVNTSLLPFCIVLRSFARISSEIHGLALFSSSCTLVLPCENSLYNFQTFLISIQSPAYTSYNCVWMSYKFCVEKCWKFTLGEIKDLWFHFKCVLNINKRIKPNGCPLVWWRWNAAIRQYYVLILYNVVRKKNISLRN